MKRIRKVLPLLFATSLIAGAIAVTAGLASAASNCTGTVNKKALCHAQGQVGMECTWDAKKTKALDCARFTYDAYRKAGLKGNYLPAYGSYNEGIKLGWTVPVKERKAGDLLFFNSNGQGVDRVGIYIGKEKMIFAAGTSSSKKSETVRVADLTAARVKQLTKFAVRPVIASAEAEPLLVNNAMAEKDTTDSCVETDDGAPVEEDTPDGDTVTPEDDTATPEGEPDADNTETEPDAEADSPEGDADGGTGCADSDDQAATDTTDDCVDTDVVEDKIVIVSPSDISDKPGVVEPAAAGDSGTEAGGEQPACDRP